MENTMPSEKRNPPTPWLPDLSEETTGLTADVGELRDTVAEIHAAVNVLPDVHAQAQELLRRIEKILGGVPTDG